MKLLFRMTDLYCAQCSSRLTPGSSVRYTSHQRNPSWFGTLTRKTSIDYCLFSFLVHSVFIYISYYSFIVQWSLLWLLNTYFFHEAFGYLLWNLFHISIYLILIVVSCVKCDCFSTQHDNCRRIKKTTKCETSNCTRLTFHERAIVFRRCVIIFH